LGVTLLTLVVAVSWKTRRFRLLGAAVFLVVAAMAFFSVNSKVTEIFGWARVVFQVVGRVDVWRQALGLIRKYPLLGVGLGNYLAALRAEHLPSPTFYHDHAHNMLLHVAAESGVPAAATFLWLWCRALVKTYAGPLTHDLDGVIRLGIFGALAAFFIRGASDHFLGGLYISDRVSVLVWTFFAMAVAAPPGNAWTAHRQQAQHGATPVA
jgi:putative inorganic carbon (hco3(-)) transporter